MTKNAACVSKGGMAYGRAVCGEEEGCVVSKWRGGGVDGCWL